MSDKEKSSRGNASQFFITGELCRRGLCAVVTLGNTPNTDILCSNMDGTKFVHIQVKTFVPGSRTCSVGVKAQKDYGDNFFWILGGIPEPNTNANFEYYIIPASVMAKNITEAHKLWMKSPKKNGGEKDQNSNMRVVVLPPRKSFNGWDIKKYLNKWDLIEKKLK